MSEVLWIIVGWLASSAAAFWLYQWWWRHEYDLELGDAIMFSILSLVMGPLFLLVISMFAASRLVTIKDSRTVVLTKYERRDKN